MTSGIWVVLITSCGAGLCAGFFMHRSDFCLAAAFRDLFLFRSTHLLRPLVLLVVVSALLLELARLVGWLPYYPFPLFGPPAAVNIIGGALFGIGMVLAGGCVVGVLYKMGGGNLLAGVAFCGLLVGSALYAEIHPWWSQVAKATVLTDSAKTLPQLLEMPITLVVLIFVAIGGSVCWFWWRSGHWRDRHAAQGFIPTWVTALVLALLGLVSALVVGMPIGVTTTYAKAAAYLEGLVLPGHVASLDFFAKQPIAYAFPFEGIVRTGGGGPCFDVIAIIQLPLIAGIVLGAFWSAWRLNEFQPRWQVPPRQFCMVFAGGVIMALGSRMTPGCNVWHIMGGLPLLTMQSMLFLAGILPGTWCGSKLLIKILNSPEGGS